MTARRRQPEAQLQRSVVQHLAWRARPGVFAFHVPLGGFRRPVEAAILKSIGTVAGVPDIICIFEGRCFCLELKSERGRLTDVQRVAHERLRAAGAEVATVYGMTRRSSGSSSGSYCGPTSQPKLQQPFNSFAATCSKEQDDDHTAE
jgi:hypothetical protein